LLHPIQAQQYCSMFLTSVNNVGSKTLFNPVKQRAQRFYACRLVYLYNNCDITFLIVFILTHPVNFPVGGNRSTRRKPTTFGRALTDSFHMSP
jgi:hypothetical protein